MSEPVRAECHDAIDVAGGSTGSRSAPSDIPAACDSYSGGALRELADTFRLLQDTRKVLVQRASPFADSLLDIEQKANRALAKEFQHHVIYDWLPKGMRGALVARLVAAIGDPRRFPGQACSLGHLSVATFDVGAPCPWVGMRCGGDNGNGPGTDTDTSNEGDKSPGVSCPGLMQLPRTGTGVRSLWHYLGLIEREGKLVGRRKGSKADYSPRLRSLLLMPNVGIRSQIIKHRTPVYREAYDDAKVRLLERGLPRHRADKIAGIIAVKRFTGDLLMEWKRRVA